jgi:hypothetical protein
MSLDHHLGIVKDNLENYLHWKTWKHLSFRQMVALMPAPVSLHDDILQYMSDSLAWIPSYNPLKREEQHGLNFCGITAITNSGARIAADVFRTWALLFSLGPERLKLTGPWTSIVGSSEGGKHSVVRARRKLLVNTLEALSRQCEEGAKSKNGSFILHLGI